MAYNRPPEPEPRPWRRYLRFSSLGIELGLAVMVGLIGGDWLDKQFGTKPWLMVAGLLLGLAAGFRSMLRALKQLNAPPPGQDSGAAPPRP